MNILWHFLCWRFYRFVIYREVKPFFFWFYPPMLYYDVSLHDLVELIIIFETSPSSSKTKFRCSSYGSFRIADSDSFQRGGDSGPRAETPAKTPAKTPGGCPVPPGSCPGVCPGVWDPETPPPGRRLRSCKPGDSGISHFQRLFFVGDLYKAPFFPIWLLQLSSLSPPLLTLKSLPSFPSLP